MRTLRLITLLCAGLTVAHCAEALKGKVSDADGRPVPFAFVALMDAGFALTGSATTDAAGAFSLDTEAKSGYVVVQPPGQTSPDGLEVYAVHPRIYRYQGEADATLSLPPAATIILEAYAKDGKRLLWEDFEKQGKYGGQFVYATNLIDEAIPMTVWPVHGEKVTGTKAGAREKGLPSVLVAPGQTVAVNILFWPTAGYGKLMLRADNGGAGYTVPQAGGSIVLNVNVELARTAVAALATRMDDYTDGQQQIAALGARMAALPADDAVKAAAEADTLLVDALKLRDELELARAKTQIERVRKGSLTVKLSLPADADPAKYSVKARELRQDFLFGAYEGSPYNAKAYEAAREAGFDYATILPAWNWTQDPKTKAAEIDKTFGLSALNQLGFQVKAHGVVWMQDYGILPDFAKKLSKEELPVQALQHQQALMETLGEDIALWEAMNEPANTNVPGLSRDAMMRMMRDAAANIANAGKVALVNSPHEFSYGGKYWLYNLDGSPVDGYPETYSAFLTDAEKEGALDHIQVIGLQCYPGFHLNADWANAQGPAYTPSYLLDTLRNYARFGRNIHITELSFPSTYGKDWFAGYWREPWTEQTQADYAERVYTLAFAEPSIHSITWWDISDAKPSVISGGLIGKNGKAKPVLERITALMQAWSTPEVEATPDATGSATLSLFGGAYEITVTGPDGYAHTETFHLMEGWQGTLSVDAAG